MRCTGDIFTKFACSCSYTALSACQKDACIQVHQESVMQYMLARVSVICAQLQHSVADQANRCVFVFPTSVKYQAGTFGSVTLSALTRCRAQLALRDNIVPFCSRYGFVHCICLAASQSAGKRHCHL